ncbi:MAG TPA: ferric reductase-like transmembrane domain-containing protein [Actinocrinis sp.]|jgi:predicted ferric reductase|uniref:ferric reductase-like transmembrane domain-containing protein n=1 Tax=Actinocrinis sp. TaxID=1920516 RepID=UPI002D5E63E4|nr:ferric reductase-like transmembrane domain-containing protein [Actinocrinis sp.]HZU56372.1 ferric reductase-like transmembrane domain-containing protein [Actinocrinis sp.]
MSAASGITSSTALWYASRATGIVSLIMLTGVVVLGVAVQKRGRLPGLPKFAVVGLHRSLSLLSVAFLVIHILSAIADSYVNIRLTDAIIPFAASYEPLWLGLGTVGFDLILALIITSLLRVRIGHRTWRWVHWLAYVSWPVAIAHSLGSSTDMQSGWLLGLGIGCILAVAAALAWRVSEGRKPHEVPRAARVSVLFEQLSGGRQQ